jgi:hypothetical protein
MKAFVYFNLHSGLWSVKALDGFLKGKVVGHAERIRLKDCEFKVSEAGRQRVLRERCKNVHAGVVGEITCTQWIDIRYEWNEEHYPGLWDAEYPEDEERYQQWVQEWEAGDADMITYNPYKYSSFVRRDNEEPIHDASDVWMFIEQDGRATVFA